MYRLLSGINNIEGITSKERDQQKDEKSDV